MRPRVAPSAVRVANSFRRLLARERIKLATLAQAISSTSPTSSMKTPAAVDRKLAAEPGAGRALSSGTTSSDSDFRPPEILGKLPVKGFGGASPVRRDPGLEASQN